ncbi:hypothetical protein GCM10027569_02270 [Flindersiella endophytica]
MPLIRLQKSDQRFEKYGLASSGRPQHDADFAGGEIERDVTPDQLSPKGLREPFDANLNAHRRALPCNLGEAGTAMGMAALFVPNEAVVA